MPCDPMSFNTWPVWAIVAMAVVSHARGTVLLVREVRAFMVAFTSRRIDNKRRRIR